ncbi:MAG: ABC transporter permease [Fimbriimonadaceae bacterium]|nr:ABC transporter permease [Fimbriimonadaceae bacterium]
MTRFVPAIILILLLSLWAFGVNPITGCEIIARGAFGGEVGLSRTLVAMTPLLLTGLGMVIAWRAGMYNIGGEGQYIIGGLMGASVAKLHFGGPGVILLSTGLGGAFYGALAGWLQVKRGVHAAISTILLNFIALQILAWAVTGPLQAPGTTASQTATLEPDQMLARWSNRTDLHSGVLLAILLSFAVWVLLSYTSFGFHLRLTGENPRAARAAMLNADRIRVQAIALSGGLCGLAGGVQFLGTSGVIDVGFNQQWGFLGIPVALLGGLNALGALASSFLFGALMAGTQSLSRSVLGGDLLIFVIQGAAVLAFLAMRRREQANA